MQERIFVSLPETVTQAGTSNSNAIQQLSDLSQLQDPVASTAVDPTMSTMPEVC